jgi:hypothetical protein
MKRGIYILANNKVAEQTIALLNSIRHYDATVPVVMIPYNDDYEALAEVLAANYGVEVYADLTVMHRLSDRLNQICGPDFLARRNLLRKLACWFGPLDEFLFIDTDIVVFEPIIQQLDALSNYDFICCDYQHQHGIDEVFMPPILDANLFTQDELKEVFNSGFWGGRKGVLTEQDFEEIFTECAAHPEYFFQYNSDQTLLNYVILRKVSRRFNLIRRAEGCPGNWAGSKFELVENRPEKCLVDANTQQPLMFLHWAGLPIRPDGPYWDVWKFYRTLAGPQMDESMYTTSASASNGLVRRAIAQLKRWL